MTTLMESRNYHLAKIILTKKFKFTKEDILNELEKEGFASDSEEIGFILESFCEKGLITDYGSYYSLAI